MQYEEDLKYTRLVAVSPDEPRCPLCEENLYKNEIFHKCGSTDSLRIDITACNTCQNCIVYIDHTVMCICVCLVGTIDHILQDRSTPLPLYLP